MLVVGLGRFGGGVGVTRWLAGQGAQVTVTDAAPAESLSGSLAEIAGLDVRLRLGGHGGVDPGEFDLIIINPAVVKSRSDLFAQVLEAGVAWTTEMNLFCARCPAMVVGVTGSYGKSTACTMLAHCLEEMVAAGRAPWSRVHLGGNIGRSLLTELDRIGERDIVVLEMSNAQLEDLPRIDWFPAAAAITNLFPHHLDRYGSFQEYIQAKLNIVADGNHSQAVIVGELHEEVEPWLAKRVGNPERLVRVRPYADLQLSVPGRHNARNADCVLTLCERLGLDSRLAVAALADFRGLAHRLERVARIRGVEYINDSKSTAPAATVTAIEAISEGRDRPELIVLVGGQRKDVPLDRLGQCLAQRARLVVCFGEAAAVFAEAVAGALTATGSTAELHTADDLSSAVRFAAARAAPGDTILFSPGAPSFDSYANFSERGLAFVHQVERLPGFIPPAQRADGT